MKFDSALRKLKKLSFVNCDLPSNVNNLLCACVELKVLNIDDCSNDSDSCMPKFNALEELWVNGISWLDKTFLNDIIAVNSSLKKISFRFTECFVNTSQIMPTIVQNHPNLQELEFDVTIRFFG